MLSIWGVGFVGVVYSFLKAPMEPRSAGRNIVRAGSADSLAVGDARLVRHGAQPVFVLRLADGEIVALSALCTHYRCALTWKNASRTFVCPCHDGVFSATGDVISGLPPRALPSYSTEVRLGEILVHM